MHGDFSRLPADRGHRAVLLQQGRVLLDSDWNAQSAIVVYQDETRTRDIVGRCGGPADSAGFKIVADDGTAATNVPWARLCITPGRYYVDGILVEAAAPDAPTAALDGFGQQPVAAKAGWFLADQPHLRTIGQNPGLPEETDGHFYAAYLDVWHHHLTAEQDHALREVALAGPDTGTRLMTVWQVKLHKLDAATVCAEAHAAPWLTDQPRTMSASLQQPAEEIDPCRISTSGGYQRLENQLYRVQIHDGTNFLWSRENGSVVAGLVAIEEGHDAQHARLVIDRAGRDGELSIPKNGVVEVTSRDWELRGKAGFLATVETPQDLVLPVRWIDKPAVPLPDLGRAPIVRRWEGPPRAAAGTAELEAGIQVQFGETGTHQIGAYWAIPARAVSHAYGITGINGTIEWPKGASGPLALPPHGPAHHRTPLAILERSQGAGPVTWTVLSDCRRLFPSSTQLTTLDLVGGDGQESLRGQALPAPVRVCVRNGGRPVAAARIRFSTTDQGAALGSTQPPTGPPQLPPQATGVDGVAAVFWRLDPAGSATQTLRICLLDDRDNELAPPLTVTGRFNQPTLRLLGGDGQLAGARNTVLPQFVHVVVDSPDGPVSGVKLVAAAAPGAGAGTLVADVVKMPQRPQTLTGTGASTVTATTAGNGSASFWWQPGFPNTDTDALQIRFDDSTLKTAPLRVTAQLAAAAAGLPQGMHIEAVRLRTGTPKPLLNDADVSAADLKTGIDVLISERVRADSVNGKPVMRVVIQLPWPLFDDLTAKWNSPAKLLGTQSMELRATCDVEDVTIDGKQKSRLRWTPDAQTKQWLKGDGADVGGLWTTLASGSITAVSGWFLLDGWAVFSQDPALRPLNCHAVALPDDTRPGRTSLKLPTDDAVTGGQFVQWFKLTKS
ncbi:DUF6519 domain-containing protein [Catellatospora chokoriensis]|uniref:Uncharacterized protein n=1 Tax=Catellatospora chokoriensis TaxID=310353 RepID=A0A8J3NRW3_9ACTN|nr:DUF6519 domain-containing protein [Catellatospora chokoriensis]GIF90385.1 hypothetical protein Cch02nite_38290 [Catellatospora chokoriensis]